MASPQKENGYTPIANELLEAFLLYRFPPNTEAPRLLWFFIARKTFGFSKKTDTISITQFEKGTGLPRNTVVHWLDYLVKALLLVKALKLDKNGYAYTINKDYESWIPLVKALKLVKGRLFTSKSPLTKTSKSPLTHINKKQLQKQGIFFGNEDFTNAYNGFVEMRKLKKKPLTKRAEQLILNKLEKQPLENAIEMLNEATEKSWSSIYPPTPKTVDKYLYFEEMLSEHLKPEDSIEKWQWEGINLRRMKDIINECYPDNMVMATEEDKSNLEKVIRNQEIIKKYLTKSI